MLMLSFALSIVYLFTEIDLLIDEKNMLITIIASLERNKSMPLIRNIDTAFINP